MIAKCGERFAMRYMGRGEPSEEDVQRIATVATILDQTGKLLLVEVAKDGVPELLGEAQGWLVAREGWFDLPERVAG